MCNLSCGKFDKAIAEIIEKTDDLVIFETETSIYALGYLEKEYILTKIRIKPGQESSVKQGTVYRSRDIYLLRSNTPEKGSRFFIEDMHTSAIHEIKDLEEFIERHKDAQTKL
jgi:hypothetical protein